MHSRKLLIYNHLKRNALVYLFTLILFLTGIVFGAIIVNSMDFVQKEDLFFYLERFFLSIHEGEQLPAFTVLKSSFLYHAKYLLLMFVFGLAVIALPLVWIFVFLKGLVIGFSVGFLVNQLGFKGLLLASLSIAPQNMFAIPIYLIAGSLSMIFCMTIMRRLFHKRNQEPLLEPFVRYITIYAILLGLALFAASFEAFISNEAMKTLISSFYK